MSYRFTKSVTVLALSVFSALAASAAAAENELPGRVGRIALAQGQVTISADTDGSDDGSNADNTNAALVNWPVTSRNQIVTARGARTEVRVGSTAIRLDADSALDVVELDDDSVRLHLHYGTVSVRLHNRDVVRGFELSTPQGRVRLQEPGRLRVDAGRDDDATVVTVFEGVALLDGSGASLTVRAGRRAELQNDDIRTAQAVPNSFDDWTVLRDRRESHAAAERYVTSEMTGYEELDQHGVWRDDNEYGPLWTPRSVAAGWAPYRDGRWTYLTPWGWTWVDNAPWGYAPSHYGRWVMVNQRWCWAPGRNIGRPIWAPALVGWVGGSGWNVAFGSNRGRYAPAQGWYPLAPRDTFLPGYRVPQDHLRYINRHARNDGDRRRHGHAGLTVVQHDHFGRRGPIVVANVPRGVVAPQALPGTPGSAPPPPQGLPLRTGRIDTNGDGRVDRSDRAGSLLRPGIGGAQVGLDRNGDGRVDQIVRDRNGDGRVDRGDVGGRVLRTDSNGDGRVDMADRTLRTDANGDGRIDRGERPGRTDVNGDGKVDRNDRGERTDRSVGLERGGDVRPNPRIESDAAARRAAWMQREQDDLRNDRQERDQRNYGPARYSAGTVSGPAGVVIAPRAGMPPSAQQQSAPAQAAGMPAPPVPAAVQPQGDRFGRMRELELERRQRQSDTFNRPSPMPMQTPTPMAMPAPPPRPPMAPPAPMPMPQQQVQMARPSPMQAAPMPQAQPAPQAPAPRADNGQRERPQRLTNGRDRENQR